MPRSLPGGGLGASRGAVREGWAGAVDQTVYAASNFLLSVAVASGGSASTFGSFAVGLAVVQLAVAAHRGLLGLPLLLAQTRSADAYTSLSWWFCLCALSLVAPLVFLSGGRLALPLAVVALPVLMCEAGRYLAMRSTPLAATRVDLVWLLGQGASMVLLAQFMPLSEAAVYGWGIGACLGAGLAGFGRLAKPGPAIKAFRSSTGRTSAASLFDQVWLAIERLAIASLAAFAFGAAASGGLRAAQTVYAPAVTILTGVRNGALARGSRKAIWVVGPLGAVLSVGTLVAAWGFDSIVSVALGESYDLARGLLPLVAVYVAVNALAMSLVVGALRSARQRSVIVARIAGAATVALATWLALKRSLEWLVGGQTVGVLVTAFVLIALRSSKGPRAGADSQTASST